ncbi:ChbG/HpnK family deacetylase [Legionella saoudiensis]|uniref:ChbG/HpnK family deacetylase n=1 Tax=Legionella saoudiensis TaxID=1750561 RepID=UPI000730362D|nr:ChbG/HpnK family deacetylase [Legionella saoudiensis]
MSELKSIRLCADDFGLNSGVSQGILKLAQLGRLSAVSCMVNMPAFPSYAEELLALQGRVQIGLHFNLTEGCFLSMPNRPCFSLNELLIKTHLASIKLSFIAQEFKQQLAQFVQVMGRLPDFVDGHQHVHQFPRIRKVIVDLYEEQLRQQGASIRSTYPTVDVRQYRLKAKILAVTGGRALRAALAKAEIPHNAYFSGIYDFAAHTDYRNLFRSWLDSISAPTLIMCHPGEPCNEPDVIAATRNIEMNYFSSNEFLQDCQEYGVTLDAII